MRKTYVWRDGKWVLKKDALVPKLHYVMSDNWIDYSSIVTDERIEGRRAHREHMKRHNMQPVESTPGWLKERQYLRKHGWEPARRSKHKKVVHGG